MLITLYSKIPLDGLTYGKKEATAVQKGAPGSWRKSMETPHPPRAHLKLIEEKKCIHSYSQHVESLPRSVEFFGNSRQNIINTLAQDPFESKIKAFIRMNAAAEKRQQYWLQKFKGEIDEISQERDELKYESCHIMTEVKMLKNQLRDKDDIILKMQKEIIINQKELAKSRLTIDSLIKEVEFLKTENGRLNNDLKRWSHSYSELEGILKSHPSIPEYNEKVEIIDNLKIDVDHLKNELNDTQDKLLEVEKIKKSLEEQLYIHQLKSAGDCKEQFILHSSYKNQISTLHNQVKTLEGQVATLQIDLEEKRSSQNKLTSALATLREERYSERVQLMNTFKDHIRRQEQDLSTSIPLTTSSSALEKPSDRELVKSWSNKSRSYRSEDEEDISEVILDDVSQLLQSDVLVTLESQYKEAIPLLHKIKHLKIRLNKKIKKEECKREALSEQICCYKYEFASLQEQIEHLRGSGDMCKIKEDINLRVQKEKEISMAMEQAEEERKRCSVKLCSMKKSLSNMGKVTDFVRHLIQ